MRREIVFGMHLVYLEKAVLVARAVADEGRLEVAVDVMDDALVDVTLELALMEHVQIVFQHKPFFGKGHFHLFTGLAVDMHGSTSLLLILLNVIAELGIHERFITISTAFLHVFCPQELFSDSVTEQLFTDVILIRHPFSGCGLLCRREKLFCKDSIGVIFIKRPGNA